MPLKMPFEHPLSSDYNYCVFPDEVESFVAAIKGAPELTVDVFSQYSGHLVYAFTLTDPNISRSEKQAMFVSRPHAHEPAGTAAMVELARALLGDGIYHDMDDMWRKDILSRFVITLVPDANPFGSHRAPVKFWDGSEIPNEKFFLWMFGESGEKAGQRFPRVAHWDKREVTPPALLGIAYEQIDAQTYVEPNRDYRSTFFRSFFELDKRYKYDVWLDLHQTEFINSDRNAEVHLPTCYDDLSDELQAKHRALGEALHRRWRASGAVPKDKPQVPYRNNDIQRNFLTAVWLPISSRLVHLVTEVQNNHGKTPVSNQVYFQGVAMLETLDWMVHGHENTLNVNIL